MPIEFQLSEPSRWTGLAGRNAEIDEAVVITDHDGSGDGPRLLLHRPARAGAPHEVGFFADPRTDLVEISPGPQTPRPVIALAWRVALACGLDPVRLSPGEPALRTRAGLDPTEPARLEITRGTVLEQGSTSEAEFDRLVARCAPDAAAALAALRDQPTDQRGAALQRARAQSGLRHLPAPLRRELAAGTRPGTRTVQLDCTGPVARIRIVRPQLLNALDPELLEQLDQAWCAAEARTATTTIVLEASGPAFMAGVDLPRILTWIESDRLDRIEDFVRAAHRFLSRVDHSRCHTLIALQGLALGAGAEFCAAFDSVIASTQASVGFPELRLGIYPAMGGTQRVPRRIGLPAARWWILGSRRLHAQPARRLGLVDLVTDPRDLEDAVRTAAAGPPLGLRAAHHRVASGYPTAPGSDVPDGLAARTTASLLKLSAHRPLDDGLDEEIRNLGAVYSTAEAFAGIRRVVHGRGRSRSA